MTRAGRQGFAAPLALCLLATVAGLAAGSVHAVTQARRAAHRVHTQAQAAAAADLALATMLDRWRSTRWDSLGVGQTDSTESAGPPQPGAEARAVVIRVTTRLYLLGVSARVGAGTSVESTRSLELLVETLVPTFPTTAALISGGGVVVGPDAAIVADDTPPPDWRDCPPPNGAEGASILVSDGATVRREGGGPLPAVRVDSVASRAETYGQLGLVRLSEIAARADLTLPAGAILSAPLDSNRRVVHVVGDLVVTGWLGEGVLIVDGQLQVRGPFRFAGVMVAGRGILVSGSDVSVYGAVLSSGSEGVDWGAAGELRRSTCAVARVASAVQGPFAVPGRGWAELF